MSTTGRLICGPQNACQKFLKGKPGFYVYILRRPDGRPFYVGKGFGARIFQHENEARHPNDRRSNAYKLNVIRSIWRSNEVVTYEIEFYSDDETTAYAREAELIGSFKRLHEGGTLTNLAAGGGTTSGSAPSSKIRHSATLAGNPEDNPERATLNRFVLAIATMNSVVIKPAGQFLPRPTTRFPKVSRTPSLRQAVALVAAASANGVSLDSACIIPRKVVVESVEGLVENGVSCDILTSEMAKIVAAPDPSDETFKLTARQARAAVMLVGLRKCVDLGIVRDDAVRS